MPLIDEDQKANSFLEMSKGMSPLDWSRKGHRRNNRMFYSNWSTLVHV